MHEPFLLPGFQGRAKDLYGPDRLGSRQLQVSAHNAAEHKSCASDSRIAMGAYRFSSLNVTDNQADEQMKIPGIGRNAEIGNGEVMPDQPRLPAERTEMRGRAGQGYKTAHAPTVKVPEIGKLGAIAACIAAGQGGAGKLVRDHPGEVVEHGFLPYEHLSEEGARCSLATRELFACLYLSVKQEGVLESPSLRKQCVGDQHENQVRSKDSAGDPVPHRIAR